MLVSTNLVRRSLLAENPAWVTATSPSNSQGQKFKAMMVRVISSEFEKVRAQQNHCQGLRIVTHSCSTVSKTGLVDEQATEGHNSL